MLKPLVIRILFLLIAGLIFPVSLAVAQEAALPCPDIPAAESGNADAQHTLAQAYKNGVCVSKSPTKAQEWYLKAAEQGHMLAQHALGDINFSGEGLKAPDYPKAKEWYLKAANQGHGLSQLRLAFLYAENHFKGVSVDYAEAEKWFRKAAEQNAGDARFRLGNFYHHYKDPPDYTRAFIWLSKAAENEHRAAQYDLANFYREGKGTGKDIQKAIAWYERAAGNGVMQASIALANMYHSGKEVKADKDKSFHWAQKTADMGAAPIYWLNLVADKYFEEKNYAQARKYYERAAKKDDPHAIERLAEISSIRLK